MKLFDLLPWISKAMAVVAAFVVCAMMFLTAVDVFGRYGFNRPIKGSWELICFLLIVATTWGLPYCQIERSHLRVTILLYRLPPKARLLTEVIAHLLGFLSFTLISAETFLLGRRYLLMKEGNVTSTLELPYSPFLFMLCAATGLMALTVLRDLIGLCLGRK